MERKRLLDKLYREKKRLGIDTSRKKDDTALFNTNWQEYAKRWAKKTNYKVVKAYRASGLYQEHRLAIIKHYTDGKMCCMRCGCDDLRVLDIDHVNNNGAEHRKSVGYTNIVWWIMKNNFPPGFQILCKNCNWIKEIERRDQEFISRNG